MLSEPEPNQAEPHSAVFGPGLHGPTNKRARPPHRIEALPIVNKDIIRNMVWDHLDSANLVRFPR